jgi:hypothetical protein
MIPNNALEKRLNDIKNGKSAPEPPSDKVIILNPAQESIVEKPEIIESPRTILYKTAINLVAYFFISVIDGFAIKTIFNQSWSFLQMIAVGYFFYQILMIISNLFKLHK